MNLPQEKIERALTIVLDVLSERITPEANPMLFDEDVVLFSICLVEAEDSAWLLAQLANPIYPLEGRVMVLNHLRSHYREALAILRQEDPNLNQF